MVSPAQSIIRDFHFELPGMAEYTFIYGFLIRKAGTGMPLDVSATAK
jgi:hypothetical protein